MYIMYPDCCYQYPFLPRRLASERQCMTNAQIFATAMKYQPSEIYELTFQPSLAAKYNGVYQITGVAGNPKYFILLAIDSNKTEHQFTADQLCKIALKGLTTPVQPPSAPLPAKCMTAYSMYSIVLDSDPAETYNIYFKPPYDKVYNGIYHINFFAGNYSYFVIASGSKLEHVFSSDQICAIKLQGPKVHKDYPLTVPEETSGFTESVSCWWDGKQYAPGSTVMMASNAIKTCGSDGVWR
ncbi:hypothetical protein I6U48_08040 [Clostridium sp. PL3]|uniref:Uncharacterized protein n=1 Tax=Clostridium thailandense TaxID=2794346 RepID=A0A949TWP0_9CLOT|nr:hypothetical protein [Clostridium thailandense]MBV7272860.1 hypothetical protein [Clostridium thailandense]